MALKVLSLALLCAIASSAPSERIVGGTPTTIQEFPYIVALVYHYPRPNIYVQRCVGALVSSWHVLTTGFCFTGAVLSNMNVRAGSTNSLSGGVTVPILSFIKHPDYLEAPRQADMAVATLSSPLPITDTINVLYLPPQGTFLPDGTPVKVVSWGFESETGPQIEVLKTIEVFKIGLVECQEAFADYADEVVVEDRSICGGDAPGLTMCMGDSGAPMVIGQVVVGILSHFKDCGNSAYPDVFTRIDRYTNWIMEVAVPPGRNGNGTAVRVAAVGSF